MNMQNNATRRPMTLSQMLALIIGAAFTIVGLVGFFITGFDNFASPDSTETLLGFRINPMHNIVHLVIGLAGLAMYRTDASARTYGWLLLAGYGAAFIYGLFTANSDSAANFLALNSADNGLHLVGAIAGLVTALAPAQERSAGRSSTRGAV